MNISRELAETLLAVVQEGTLDAAAKRLHVTPSAVSQRIKALETQLGRVVLVRAKPARTTEAGTAVVRFAREIALLEHDALVQMGVGDDSARVSIPLAVNADSLGTWFLQPLARLAEQHPVVFDLHRDDQDFTASLLESGTVMGAVTSRRAPVSGCKVMPLGVMRYDAVATVGFMKRWLPAGPTATALDAAPVVEFDRRDDLQTRWLRDRGSAGTAPRHYVPASNDFARAVSLGLGWGLLPVFQSSEGLNDGSLVKLDNLWVDVPLYWQQWNLRSQLLDAIADTVAEAAATVLERPGV
ncbi:LysR family transcriptional regulator ArgP [Microbacterium sp. R86528]